MKKKTATFKEQFYISLEKKKEKMNLHRGCTEPCNGKNDAHTEAWNIFFLYFFSIQYKDIQYTA